MVHAVEHAVLLPFPATFALSLVVVVSSDVGDQIHWPSKQLLKDKIGHRLDGSFLHELVQIMDEDTNTRSILLSGLGNEDHIAFHVAGGLVVLSVRDLPREVGDK